MLLEAIVSILGYYIFCALGFYSYAVVKSWEYTGFWSFSLKDGYIGVCKYPKWSLFWMEAIANKVSKG